VYVAPASYARLRRSRSREPRRAYQEGLRPGSLPPQTHPQDRRVHRSGSPPAAPAARWRPGSCS